MTSKSSSSRSVASLYAARRLASSTYRVMAIRDMLRSISRPGSLSWPKRNTFLSCDQHSERSQKSVPSPPTYSEKSHRERNWVSIGSSCAWDGQPYRIEPTDLPIQSGAQPSRSSNTLRGLPRRAERKQRSRTSRLLRQLMLERAFRREPTAIFTFEDGRPLTTP